MRLTRGLDGLVSLTLPMEDGACCAGCDAAAACPAPHTRFPSFC